MVIKKKGTVTLVNGLWFQCLKCSRTMYGENLVIKLVRKNQGCIEGITKKKKIEVNSCEQLGKLQLTIYGIEEKVIDNKRKLLKLLVIQ